ncbi:MAG: insulinase family protein [Candidatus Omnitrophica bacterium]|nr:insulinase family protein [Candidatus Omnitrophota bacterium]
MKLERDVILNEIRLRKDDPLSRRMRLLFSQAYREHVYKYPIIGYEGILGGLTKEDLAIYHSAVYTPDKMVLGIVGGVPAEKAVISASIELKKYRRGLVWPVDINTEPRQVDENKYEFKEEVTLGYLAIAFHMSSLYSPDLYAGDVVSIILGEGKDSRLYQRLVQEKQLLYTVSCMNYTPKYPGLFIITGTGDAAKLEAAAEEIFSVINELWYRKVNRNELDRAKNLVLAAYYRTHESIKDMADSMTDSQALTGDPLFFEKYVDGIHNVKLEDLWSIPSKYLDRDNSTTLFLLPWYYEKEEPEAEEELYTPEPAVKERSMILENGLNIVVKKKGTLPLVSVTFAAPGGLRAENKRNNGISNLTASLILKGTKRRNVNGIVPAIERMGGSIVTFSGMNSVGMTMELMSKDIDKGLDIFEDVLRNATFPEEEIVKEKEKIIAAIREEETDVFQNGMIHLFRLLYGQNPYSMRISGEVKTVEPIMRDELHVFYKDRFIPYGAVLTLVGDVADVEYTLNMLAKRFSGWNDVGLFIRTKKVEPVKEKKVQDVFMRKEQSLVIAGFQGARIIEDKKYTLSVISAILSGSDGLLFHNAREKEGLTYASNALNAPGVYPGYFVMYVATTESNLEKAQKTIFDVIEKVKKGDISEEEIEAAKKRLISEHEYSLQANSALSMIMTLDEMYGLGFQDYKKFKNKINAITMKDIVSCAKEYLDSDKSAVIFVHSE